MRNRDIDRTADSRRQTAAQTVKRDYRHMSACIQYTRMYAVCILYASVYTVQSYCTAMTRVCIILQCNLQLQTRIARASLLCTTLQGRVQVPQKLNVPEALHIPVASPGCEQGCATGMAQISRDHCFPPQQTTLNRSS